MAFIISSPDLQVRLITSANVTDGCVWCSARTSPVCSTLPLLWNLKNL